MAFETVAVYAVPGHFSSRSVIDPDGFPGCRKRFGFGLLVEVNTQDREAAARKEQVLFVKQLEQCGCLAQVERKDPGTGVIVCKELVAGLDIGFGKVGGPPTGGYAYLRCGAGEVDIECFTL